MDSREKIMIIAGIVMFAIFTSLISGCVPSTDINSGVSQTISETEEPGNEGMMSNISVKYPSNIFVEGETVRLYHTDIGEPVNWVLKDWNGKTVNMGEMSDFSRPLVFSDIDFGYYTIEIHPASKPDDKTKVHFSYVRDLADIAASGEVVYALDTAQSIFSISNQLLGDLAIIAGVNMIRDRLIWPSIKLQGSDTDWKKFDETVRIYKDTPVRIVNCMHLAPPEVRGSLKDLPFDLQALFEFTKEAASHFSDSYEAVEFWNEIDLVEFCRDPAWDYAAAQKAAYLGMKAGNPDLDVLVSSTTQNIDMMYTDVVFANDIGEHFDIFNFHTYTDLSDYKKVFQGKADLMRKWNITGKPFWVTEFGISLREAEGKGDQTVTGKPEHDTEQEMLQAEFLVKGNVLLQSMGSRRNFFFILPPWNSSDNKVHGLFRQDMTVKAGYTAHTALVSMLGGQECKGRAVLGSDVEGYLYESENGVKTLIFWGTGTIDLGSENDSARVYDMMGTSIIISQASEGDLIKATALPQYIVGINGITTEKTNIIGSAGSEQSDRTVDRDIVLRVVLGDDFGVLNRISAKSKAGSEVRIKLDIFNFSDQPKQVELKDVSENCSVRFDVSTVDVPAMGVFQVDAQVTIRSNGPMIIEGITSDGEVTAVYIPMIK